MDFDELQKVWDEQKDEPMYAMNQDAMHEVIRRRGRLIGIQLARFECVMLVLLPIVATILAGRRLYDTDHVGTYHTFAILLMLVVGFGSAVLFWLGRRKRQKSQDNLDNTILSDLDRAISLVNFHLARIRSFHWWFVLPIALIVTLSNIARGRSFDEALSGFALFGASCVLAGAMCYVEVRCIHFPRLRNLQSLRDTLTSEQ